MPVADITAVNVTLCRDDRGDTTWILLQYKLLCLCNYPGIDDECDRREMCCRRCGDV